MVIPRRIAASRSCNLVLLGAILFAGPCIGPPRLRAQAPAASAPSPRLTLNARTVIVDVVVTAKNGRPVTGLHKEDFAIAEDGHPQEITSFEEHPGPHPQPPPSPLPPNVFTNVPRATPAGSPIVLLFDALNTPLTDQVRVHKQVLQYLQQLQPGTPMAIFTLGRELRCIQGFTGDPAALRSAAQDPNSGDGPQASTLLDSKSEITAETAATQIRASLREFLAEQTSSQDSSRTLITLDALQRIAHYLAGIPGRKSVIWFSGAFPTTIFPDLSLTNPTSVQRSFADETRKADAELAAAQVAIYPIAAEGLANDPLYDANTQLTGQSAMEIQAQSIASLNTGASERNADHATMDQIANDTGGKAFYNNNGLDRAIDRVAEDGSHYYTLSYTPSKPSPSQDFRKIKVSVKAEHRRLAYRRGYFTNVSEPAQAARPGFDPLRPYMQPGAPGSTEIPIAMLIEPAPADGTHTSASDCSGDNHHLTGPCTCYSVSIVIAARGLQFNAAPGGLQHGAADVTLLVYNQGGTARNWVVRHVDLNMNAALYAQVQSNGVPLNLTIGVPSDAASLSTGVYDPASNLAGTLTVSMARIRAAIQPSPSKPR